MGDMNAAALDRLERAILRAQTSESQDVDREMIAATRRATEVLHGAGWLLEDVVTRLLGAVHEAAALPTCEDEAIRLRRIELAIFRESIAHYYGGT